MTNNKFILSVASIAFATITFTNVVSSRADSATIIGAGNALGNGAGQTSANNAVAVGATGPNPSVDSSTTTISNGNTASAENGGFATGGVPGRFVTGGGRAEIDQTPGSNPTANAGVNTFNTQRTPKFINGTSSNAFGGQQQTTTPSNTPAPAASFGYQTSF
jgi:hypothetical protein